jgi:hypothetical protein
MIKKRNLLSASILLAIFSGVQANDQAAIPEYSSKSIAEGDELDIQYALVNDHADFIRPLSYLAHTLGYAWVGGNNSQYIGEDMTVEQWGDKWIIQGNNNGDCSGYRCGDKTRITIDNFKYTLNPGEFWHGDVLESEKELIKTIPATVRNLSNVSQMVVIDFSVAESTTWSKEDTFSFSESVTTESSFSWPLVGETSLAITFGTGQSFSSSNGGSSSETQTFQARATVPPNSEIPIRIQLYRSNISYPYRFGANISYDVTFDGFLRWSGNAWHTHPDNRPNLIHTFTMGRVSEPYADIRYQWDHRDSPVHEKWWDWNWAISENGLNVMQNVTGASLRPFYSYVSGNFSAESQYAGEIEFGQATEIDSGSGSIITKLAKVYRTAEDSSETIQVISDFDADELESLGFGNAEFSVRVVEE